MTPEQIIKAWKDPHYRASLTDDERARLPANPAGTVELTDAQLGEISGAGKKESVLCTSPSLCQSASIICATPICKTNFYCGTPIAVAK